MGGFQHWATIMIDINEEEKYDWGAIIWKERIWRAKI